MADYINREDFEMWLLESASRFAKNSEEDETDVYGAVLAAAYLAIYDAAREFPSADVRKYVPGKWLRTDAVPHRVYCSVCFATYLRNEKWAEELQIKLHPNYCPNCGAQMEVDGDE